MKKQFAFQTKLLFLCSGISLVAVIVGTIGIYSLRAVNKEFHDVADVSMPNIRLINDMIAEARKLRIDLRAQAIPGLTAEEYRGAREAALKTLDNYEAKMQLMSGSIDTPEEKAALAEISSIYDEFKALAKSTIEQAEKNEKIAWDYFYRSENELGLKWRTALVKFEKIQLEAAKSSVDDVQRAVTKGNVFMVSVSLGGLFIAMFVGFLFSRSLSRKLQLITDELNTSGEQVNSASHQLTTASQNLASSATESAASLEETVASIEELSSMVKINSDNAKEAAALSQSSKSAAEKGEVEIRALIEAMGEIAKGSKKIEEIINVIEDISFQTNLLALNAAVEAARAGDMGRGFAVVADAVRTLAGRSSEAAKEINTMIKDSVEKIEKGVRIADQSGEVLKAIVTSVKKVADLNTEISSASLEQSNGITQIGKAMNQLDGATQSNASSAEEAAASSEEMSAQAQTLRNLVGDLSTVITGEVNSQTPSGQQPKEAQAKATPRLVELKRPVVASPRSPAEVIPFPQQDEPRKMTGTTAGF